ncbi:hypothetical protein VNI00_000431 [Paramarasmius palmivorus]|uniref:Uncharacterized protein n=1 Tax=Paramarasmius palmivorus TaxID=297713 RepID=A0AAW0EAY0_9AGAR
MGYGYDIYAIYSGYQISPESFTRFVSTLPLPNKPILWELEKTEVNKCVIQYDAWRSRLTKREKGFVPVVRLRYKEHLTPDDELEVEKIFFPTRSVPYRNENQLEQAEKTARETDVDRAKLEGFVRFVQDKGATLDLDLLDPTEVEFGVLKTNIF